MRCWLSVRWSRLDTGRVFFHFFLPFNEPRRQGISLFACFVDSLWQRARNVSFRISLQWPIYIAILIHKTILCLSCCCCLFVCSFVVFLFLLQSLSKLWNISRKIKLNIKTLQICYKNKAATKDDFAVPLLPWNFS